MIKATESKLLVFFLILGTAIGFWFANAEEFLSAEWATKFFSAQSAISVLSSLFFRIISAENRYRSTEQTKNIETQTREIAEIIPQKFKESAKHLETSFKKIEFEAVVRYNRQMMSQEKDFSEFWHYQQDFGREKTLNICLNHGTNNPKIELQDDYELEILGTYESTEGGFSNIFYIVRVLSADARGKHETIFKVDEKLACSYSNTPKISRSCDHFNSQSYKFYISGRMGVITYGDSFLAQDVTIEKRLVDLIDTD